MKNVALAAIVLIATGCKVPALDLEGKQCPCSDGFVCDTATNTCVSTIDADPLDPDASEDAPLGGCLAGGVGALLYGTAFTSGNLQWTEPFGDWGVSVGEALQTDAALALAYAYPDQTANETDYRITTKLRQVNGDGADSLGVALRAQPNPPSSGHYSCSWEPNTGNLVLAHTSADGNTTTPLANVVVDTAAIPGYMPANPQIMEARAQGTRLDCCLRGIPTARVMFDDSRYTTGGPGYRTAGMSAAFDDLAINALP